MSSLHDVQTARACPSFLQYTGPVTFLDVETVLDRVVEIALVRFVVGEQPSSFATLVDPELRVWVPRARRRAAVERRVHGIGPLMVRGKPTFLDLIPVVRHFCAGTTVVSHNASYERRIMRLEFERFGQFWDYPQLCTLKLARNLYPGRRGGRGYSLGSLAADLQVPVPAQHRAAADVCTLTLVVWRMLEENAGLSDLGTILAEASTSSPQEVPEV